MYLFRFLWTIPHERLKINKLQLNEAKFYYWTYYLAY